MSKMSIAFAAHREAFTVELQQLLASQLVPEFNAEMEHIRRVHEEEKNNPKIGEALADHRKRAAYEDARVRRETFIQSLQSRLRLELEKKVKDYGGEIKDSEDREGKKLQVANFPDGSTARMPRALWINFKLFERP